MDYAFKLTTNGRSLIAACGALEKPLRVSRVAVGSGQVPEETDLADVHELYHYVADGSIGERRHENDRLYLTIQYANSEHKEQPTFFLSEFLVYAQHPESGEETDLLYATLGDYQQPVPAYRPELPGSIFNFPLVIVVSDEIQVEITAAPGLVSHDDLQRLMNEGVIGISRSEITIPANGWTDSREDAADGVGGDPAFGNYPFHVDVSVTGTKSRMTPIVTIYPQHLSIAKDICQTAETIEGAVRFYAKAVPSSDIKASLALVGGSGYISTGGGGGSDIPIASRTSLGGVIIGDGINVDFNGRISVDKETVMTDADLVDEEAVQQDVAEILDGED